MMYNNFVQAERFPSAWFNKEMEADESSIETAYKRNTAAWFPDMVKTDTGSSPGMSSEKYQYIRSGRKTDRHIALEWRIDVIRKQEGFPASEDRIPMVFWNALRCCLKLKMIMEEKHGEESSTQENREA